MRSVNFIETHLGPFHIQSLQWCITISSNFQSTWIYSLLCGDQWMRRITSEIWCSLGSRPLTVHPHWKCSWDSGSHRQKSVLMTSKLPRSDWFLPKNTQCFVTPDLDLCFVVVVVIFSGCYSCRRWDCCLDGWHCCGKWQWEGGLGWKWWNGMGGGEQGRCWRCLHATHWWDNITFQRQYFQCPWTQLTRLWLWVVGRMTRLMFDKADSKSVFECTGTPSIQYIF